jgi:hypothetical protein
MAAGQAGTLPTACYFFHDDPIPLKNPSLYQLLFLLDFRKHLGSSGASCPKTNRA